MIKTMIRNNSVIEKLREIEIYKSFDTEGDAKLYASVVYDMFKDDFVDFGYEIEKYPTIVIEGPHIGERGVCYHIKFNFKGRW